MVILYTAKVSEKIEIIKVVQKYIIDNSKRQVFNSATHNSDRVGGENSQKFPAVKNNVINNVVILAQKLGYLFFDLDCEDVIAIELRGT